MLEPIPDLSPRVIGFEMSGKLPLAERVTATAWAAG